MKRIKLDARLETLAKMVDQNIVADIGTDHAYLLTWLLQNEKIKFGYACDVNNGPLERAKATLCKYQIKSNFELVLTDGLYNLEDKKIEQFVLAGMGGELISRLLLESKWCYDKQYSFLLQPMTKDFKLRSFLYYQGFEIVEEQAVESGNFVYTCMKVTYTGVVQDISPQFAWAGLHWDSSAILSRKYLFRKFQKLKKMKPSFQKNDGYDEMLLFWMERFEHYDYK